MNQLDRVGGAAYITELIETVPAAGNAMYYAGQVRDKATLRGLIHAADDIAEIGYSDPESVDEALDQAEKSFPSNPSSFSTKIPTNRHRFT